MNPLEYPLLSPYLAVVDAAKALSFYQEVFGAEERFRLVDKSNGQISHAELFIQGSLVMLAEENPAWNKAPGSLGGTAVKLCLMVDNPDAVIEKAAAAGATVIMPPQDQFYGFRSGSIRDPFGHEWMLQREIEKVSHEEMQRRWDAMLEGCRQQTGK